jgi:MoxR-like ATPase
MVTVKRKSAPANEMANHPLANLIPGKEKYESYASRKIGGIQDVAIFQAALKQRHNVAVYGPTGCAKTTVIYAVGFLEQLPVFSVPCNGAADPEYIFGGYMPNPDGTFTLRPGPLYYIAKYGGIGYLDEFNFLPPRIGAILHGCLDSRRTMIIPSFAGSTDLDAMGNPIESVIKLHKRAMFVASWNPGYAGTYAMNAAMLNRFAHKLRFDYMRSVEEELTVSGHLLDMAEQLRHAVNAGTLRTPVSTNALIEFEDFAQDTSLGLSYAVENFINMFAEDERKVVNEVLLQFVDKISLDLFDEVPDQEFGVDTDDEDFDDFDEDPED